jgi:hypothetical protein
MIGRDSATAFSQTNTISSKSHMQTRASPMPLACSVAGRGIPRRVGGYSRGNLRTIWYETVPYIAAFRLMIRIQNSWLSRF